MVKSIKIVNLTTQYGQIDYKGLDVDQFIPGSQIYKKDLSECAIATTEEAIPNHPDLIELTEEEYGAYRQAIIAQQQAEVVTTEQRLADLEAGFAAMYGM